ncbi:MAG: hypothetical protein EYC69_04295 [Bacteroidetes bacterium]|nr:MAG: hypothetical protein EYC69_04295 [Bacteroidota bacterium]
MKLKIASLLFVMSLLCLHSCTPLLRIVYGVHKPRLESVGSVVKYAESRRLDSAIILVPKDSVSFRKVLSCFARIPDLYLFNAEGKALLYSDSAACNAPVFNVIDSICDGNYRPDTKGKELWQILDFLKPLTPDDSIRFADSQKRTVRYTGFISWAKYIGYLNKDHTRPWVNSSNKSKGCNYNIYLVNLDYLEEIWKQ